MSTRRRPPRSRRGRRKSWNCSHSRTSSTFFLCTTSQQMPAIINSYVSAPLLTTSVLMQVSQCGLPARSSISPRSWYSVLLTCKLGDIAGSKALGPRALFLHKRLNCCSSRATAFTACRVAILVHLSTLAPTPEGGEQLGAPPPSGTAVCTAAPAQKLVQGATSLRCATAARSHRLSQRRRSFRHRRNDVA